MRFIVNLPREELESVERICFQVEEAQWFYEDFIRPLDPNLPSLNLRQFCLRIFQHCPLLSGFSSYHHATAFSEFLAYKTRVPVRGAIMLNEAMDEVLLVKGWKKNANWSFPRGKINKDEPDLECAIREVYEETGFDIKAAGLAKDEAHSKSIEVTMREQHMRLYVFRGVPMDTHFEPRTRKEISKIQWYKLSELPTLRKKNVTEGSNNDLAVNANKFYMVAPFLVPLKKWITQQKKQDSMKPASVAVPETTVLDLVDETQNGNGKMASTDDMSRLMAGLRQSHQAATSIAPQSELSDPVDTARDASLQLKSLLKVPSVKPGHDTVRKGATSDTEKSAALLSLLQHKPASLREPTGDSKLPHTPDAQVLEPPPMPISPEHRSIRPQDSHRNLPPPNFPLPLHGIGTTPEYGPHTAERPSSHARSHPVPVLTPHYLPPSSVAPSFSGQTLSQPTYPPVAPYQRTGDPRFRQSMQQPMDQQRRDLPTIPSASQLPLPRLTKHSSALLDIFRSGNMSEASTSPIGSPAIAETTLEVDTGVEQQLPMPARPEQYNAKEAEQSGLQVLGTPVVVKRAPSPVSPPDIHSRQRSSHQDTLLELFRKPSNSVTSASQLLSSHLEDPSARIELSAHATPGHSREPSRVSESTEQAKPAPSYLNGSARVQKRPAQGPSRASTSATVTGPLDVPQFHAVPKAAKNLMESHIEQQIKPAASMTILSRPPPINGSTQHAYQNQAPAAPMGAILRPRNQEVSPIRQSKETEEPPKTDFHPQILRRSAQTARPVSESRDMRTMPLPLETASPTPDQKQTLLSLFKNPNTIVGPSSSVGVSPISAMPPRSESKFLMHPTSGPMLGTGEGGKRAPVNNPVDKNILLGYLSEVVKGQSRV